MLKEFLNNISILLTRMKLKIDAFSSLHGSFHTSRVTYILNRKKVKDKRTQEQMDEIFETANKGFEKMNEAFSEMDEALNKFDEMTKS